MTSELILFDIDGTLIRGSGPYHRIGLINAIRKVTSRETSIEGIPFHGMLDGDIIQQMLERAGAGRKEIARAQSEIFRWAQESYPDVCPPLHHCVCPGVRATLRLIERQGIPMGLVSGNVSRVGWTKVARAGLRQAFRFGAFADMGKTRVELAGLAARTAIRAGLIHKNSRVTLIGDAPSDVQAAKANGFRSIAVATGMSTADALRALEPDLVLSDLSRAEDRMQLIEG